MSHRNRKQTFITLSITSIDFRLAVIGISKYAVDVYRLEPVQKRGKVK